MLFAGGWAGRSVLPVGRSGVCGCGLHARYYTIVFMSIFWYDIDRGPGGRCTDRICFFFPLLPRGGCSQPGFFPGPWLLLRLGGTAGVVVDPCYLVAGVGVGGPRRDSASCGVWSGGAAQGLGSVWCGCNRAGTRLLCGECNRAGTRLLCGEGNRAGPRLSCGEATAQGLGCVLW